MLTGTGSLRRDRQYSSPRLRYCRSATNLECRERRPAGIEDRNRRDTKGSSCWSGPGLTPATLHKPVRLEQPAEQAPASAIITAARAAPRAAALRPVIAGVIGAASAPARAAAAAAASHVPGGVGVQPGAASVSAASPVIAAVVAPVMAITHIHGSAGRRVQRPSLASRDGKGASCDKSGCKHGCNRRY